MSKIICDVCGTSYPESVTQCPICGCVRSVDVRTVDVDDIDETQTASSAGYTHVKGGRFSKSNVKKRRNVHAPENHVDEEDSNEEQDVESKKTDKGLLLAFIVLLFSVIAVVCYILVKFFAPELLDPTANKKPNQGYVEKDPVVETQPEEESTSCEDITIAQNEITLSKANATFQINITLTPADTEDEVTYSSSNEEVATVSEDGLVTAIGEGEAIITVTCGEIEKTCTVTCKFEEETTLPSVPVVDLPVTPAGFELNRSSFSLFKKGETWTLYSGSIPSSEITWTSSNPKVATVSNGKVTAVSTGKTIITATYQGSELQCTVYCKDSVGSYTEPATPDNGDQPTELKYKLNTANRKNDITIYVGRSYTIKLLDENGQAVEATFTSSRPGVCTVTADGKVVGKAAGKSNITVTYGGETHVCIVRVRAG